MQSDVCADLDTRSLFPRSSPESGKFFTERPFLRAEGTSMICEITNILEVRTGPVYNLYECVAET